MKYVVNAAVTCMVLAGTMASALEIGQIPEEVTFKDIRYLPRTLADFGERGAHVLLFHQAGDAEALSDLDALAEAHTGTNVTIAALDQSPGLKIRDLAANALKAEASYIVLKDYDSAAARALGINALPAAVVLDADHALRYRGPLSGVAMALDAVLHGGKIAKAEEKLNGAPLPDWSIPTPETAPTFADNIAPIINKYCYECHRKGQAAPFTLKTYNQVAHRANMIAEVVREGRMPPWYASPEHGEFMNDRSMTEEESLTLRQWVEAGMPSGDLNTAPMPPDFAEDEWRIGTPDRILTSPMPFKTPAVGFIPYQYVLLPYIFPEETWLQGIEILPSNPAVVHHANLAYSDPKAGRVEDNFNFLTGYVPGGQPVDIPGGAGVRIPKGALMALQIHYISTGKEAENVMRVGLRYAKGMVLKELHHQIIGPQTLEIAPHDPNFPVHGEWELDRNAVVVGMFSHMHLRGRDMSVFVKYPDNRNDTLLVVPNYSFNWQMAYEIFPGKVVLPKGTKITTKSHFDNSAFNPYNPDPERLVTWGEQTEDEMNSLFMFYVDQDEMLQLIIDGKTGTVVGG